MHGMFLAAVCYASLHFAWPTLPRIDCYDETMAISKHQKDCCSWEMDVRHVVIYVL